MEFTLEIHIGTGVCETCAERGRPNEPVYKMGMCTFCYHGLPHPKATSEQLAREKMGAFSRQRLSLFPGGESAVPDVVAGQRQNQELPHERIVDVLTSRNRRVEE
jgi:hypothetical protein